MYTNENKSILSAFNAYLEQLLNTIEYLLLDKQMCKMEKKN